MENTAIVIFSIQNRGFETDLEIPIDITANDLVYALNSAYELGIDLTDMKNCYLKAEKPIALLKGNRLLSEFGVRNGTIIIFAQ